MSKRFEPDTQFVDRLEWQLASEFRRREHLKPAPGRIAVPRSVAVLSLAAGVLLLGVAATKAADLIKDSWRKKIEVARLETEVKIKTAFLDLKKERCRPGRDQVLAGPYQRGRSPGSEAAAARAAAELEKARPRSRGSPGRPAKPRATSSTRPWSAAATSSANGSRSRRRSSQADLDLRRDRIERDTRHPGRAWGSFRRAPWTNSSCRCAFRPGGRGHREAWPCGGGSSRARSPPESWRSKPV